MCPFKNKEYCCKKYAIGVLWFALSVLVLSLIIKLAAWVLSWFSGDVYLNTVIVIISAIVMLIAWAKCCGKISENKACGDTEAGKESH